MRFPDQLRVADALHRFIAESGGSVQPYQTYAPLANSFGLTENQRRMSRGDYYGGPAKKQLAWEIHVQYSRLKLIDKGILDPNAPRGTWRLKPGDPYLAEMLRKAEADRKQAADRQAQEERRQAEERQMEEKRQQDDVAKKEEENRRASEKNRRPTTKKERSTRIGKSSTLARTRMASRSQDALDDLDQHRSDYEKLHPTERENIRKSRIGQGQFRKDLLRYWKNECAVTGIAEPLVLRASHIKPWRDSTNKERLDWFNGLLLAPHLDALFDAGLISFEDDGRMLVSRKLKDDDRRKLGVSKRMPIKKTLDEQHKKYLRFHRELHKKKLFTVVTDNRKG